ncbi:hypothetical protein CIK06_02170 [Plantactinospora sp. KBS50]|nr:hypothetical protein CIK06_02170 [Plantactinospora sp. KBS50]
MSAGIRSVGSFGGLPAGPIVGGTGLDSGGLVEAGGPAGDVGSDGPLGSADGRAPSGPPLLDGVPLLDGTALLRGTASPFGPAQPATARPRPSSGATEPEMMRRLNDMLF